MRHPVHMSDARAAVGPPEQGFTDTDRLDWLSAAYDRHGRLAYALAARILGGPAGADDVVERAFLSIAATVPPSMAIESVGEPLRRAVCNLARAALRTGRAASVDEELPPGS